MDAFEAIKATFFQECAELLADLEAKLLVLESGQTDTETINAVFRAVHSVKGGAGAFGLEALVRFAHVFETLMDELRAGRKPCDDVTVRTLLRASDVLADHIAAAQGLTPEVDEARSAGLVAEMEVLTHGEASTPGAAAVEEDDDFGFVPLTVGLAPIGLPDLAPASLDLAPLAPVAAEPAGWRVVFRPHGSMYANANETGLLLRELGRLGPVAVSLDDSAVPALDLLNVEENHIVWTLDLTAPVAESAVREVFDFVESDCDLSVTPLGGAASTGSDLPDLPAAPDAAPSADLDIAALLARAAASAPVIEETPPVIAAPPVAAPMPVAAPVAAPVVAAPPAPIAANAPAAPAAPAAAAPATIRVDLDRVDRLINVVGELVIQQAMLAQRVIESGLARSSGISVGLEDLELLTREIQDSVMAIRAQPVKSVFQRMPRLVREVANMTGKQARLVMDGENTEVDKTVIERLSDPITHMLRNAIDHGLENPEERKAAGKNPEGVVRLAALHRSGRIVIEVSDDGKGINRERVFSIAVKKGLIAPDLTLTDEEIDNLIFLPGFSTADKISDVSGRGVGMDVVKRSVQALGGRISITSRPGQGSTFTLSLPLTLAVLDGMVVDVAGETLVVPLAAIVESLRPKPEEVRPLGPVGSVLAVRDSFVPLIDVGLTLGYRDQSPHPTDGVVLLVEGEDGSRAALVADAIHGQRQVVIKSLEQNYQQVEGVAAATILGDGRVALILDVDATIAMRRREGGAPRPTEPTLIAAE